MAPPNDPLTGTAHANREGERTRELPGERQHREGERTREPRQRHSPRIAVGGDSAGGQLAALICHHAKKNDLPQPILQLLVYPWLTAVADTPSYTSCADAWPLNTKLMRWFVDHYIADPAQLTDTRVSPLLENDFAKLAPALIYSAGFDPLRDEAALYAKKLTAANVPTTYHCFDSLTHSFTTLRGASKTAQHACETIAQNLSESLLLGNYHDT